MDSSIQRLYYSITEVSKIIGEEQHVLRYWEREFTQLRPQKNRAGNRVYTKKDLDTLQLIKRLLRDERYTVAGAKDHLKTQGVVGTISSALEYTDAEEVETNELSETASNVISVNLESAKALLHDIQDISAALRNKIALAS